MPTETALVADLQLVPIMEPRDKQLSTPLVKELATPQSQGAMAHTQEDEAAAVRGGIPPPQRQPAVDQQPHVDVQVSGG